MNTADLDAELERHVRDTLNGVAASVEDRPKSRRHVRRGVLAAVVSVSVVSSIAAFVVIRSGPEYVDRLPTENALLAGQAHGTRYWLVPSFHKDACGRPMPGVELLVESLNKVGQEWNTGGISLESDTASMGGDCRPQDAKPLPPPGDPAMGMMRIGKDGSRDSDWAFMAAVHPTITTIRITVDGTDRVLPTVPRNDQPDGVRYAIAAIPPTTKSYSVVLLQADGRVVPCAEPKRCGPRQLPGQE